MSRIRKAYEARLRALLLRAGARRLEAGIDLLARKAEAIARAEGLTAAATLARLCEHIASTPYFRRPEPLAPPHFLCDAGLGGLARWLRAAGYESRWRAGIQDDALVRQALEEGLFVLTTDSLLMQRRVLREGTIPGLWIPPTLKIPGQVALVFKELRLSLRAPRCMGCGGILRREDKTRLGSRIPPRTYLWLDEFFLCEGCGNVFWHGTHWQRIQERLKRLAAG